MCTANYWSFILNILGLITLLALTFIAIPWKLSKKKGGKMKPLTV